MECGWIEGANGHARTHAGAGDRQVAARLICGARVSQQPDDACEYHADRDGRAPAQGWGGGGGMNGVGVWVGRGYGWGWGGWGGGGGLPVRGMGWGQVTTAPQARRGTPYCYILLTAYHSASTSRHKAPHEGGSPAIDHRWRREHTEGGARPSIKIDHRCRWTGE